MTETSKAPHTNRLASASSPYLLQHADNPVDWFPWGEEAFQKARDENKLIFLSIGYSSCHWCHVMAHESFENEDIAALMNEHFVNVKVDREEHPDVDKIYMDAIVAITGQGGWPLSAFLTPELKPFYGGTYYPPADRYGRPGFPRVLTAIAKAWNDDPEKILTDANNLTEHITERLTLVLPEDNVDVSSNMFHTAVQSLEKSYDPEWGGFGSAPKFPPHGALNLLLRYARNNPKSSATAMLSQTLTRMARGGIYDHLGGGFARYSVDHKWLVPHFEKMLYDNAQLTHIYLEAHQLTGDPTFLTVAKETMDYVLRDMTDDDGGFYSAEDADSEGVEGKFYVWSPAEIVDILGAKDADIFNSYYDVTEAGNFEGHSILNVPVAPVEMANTLKLSEAQLRATLDPMRATLLKARDTRIGPGLDDKVLVSWNSMMISAFALGYEVSGDTRYRDAAQRAATFMATTMMHGDGDLHHSYRKGKAHIPAHQDDYATLILAFMDVYEISFDPVWIDRADTLMAAMLRKFYDRESGLFYFTSDEHKHLLTRSRSTSDSQVPSGNASAALALLRLATFTGNTEYDAKGRRILDVNSAGMMQSGQWFGHMLVAADFTLNPPKEIAIVGQPDSDETKAMLTALRQCFIPNRVLSVLDPTSSNAANHQKRIPLLKGKTTAAGATTAYVCENFTCKQPVSNPDDLLKQLGVSRNN